MPLRRPTRASWRIAQEKATKQLEPWQVEGVSSLRTDTKPPNGKLPQGLYLSYVGQPGGLGAIVGFRCAYTTPEECK